MKKCIATNRQSILWHEKEFSVCLGTDYFAWSYTTPANVSNQIPQLLFSLCRLTCGLGIITNAMILDFLRIPCLLTQCSKQPVCRQRPALVAILEHTVMYLWHSNPAERLYIYILFCGRETSTQILSDLPPTPCLILGVILRWGVHLLSGWDFFIFFVNHIAGVVWCGVESASLETAAVSFCLD